MALDELARAFEELQRTHGLGHAAALEGLPADQLCTVASQLYRMLARCAGPAPTSRQSLGDHSVLIPSLVSNIPNIAFAIDEFDTSSSDEEASADRPTDGSTPSREFRLSRSASSRISVDGYEYINDYMIVDQIGKGQFGRVVLAVRDGETDPVAIKIIPRQVLKKSSHRGEAHRTTDGANSVRNPDLETLQHEVAVMKKLKHKNIVQLYECIDDAQEGNLYLVMQYVDQGPVFSLDEQGCCSTLPVTVVRDYVRQVVAGLSYLHQCGVLHLDIKPDNLLLSKEGTLYIADFGVSVVIEHTPENLGMLTSPQRPSITKSASGSPSARKRVGPTAPTQRGTPAFMSPEMCLGKDVSGATDVWSLGVTVYCMLHGHLPFRGHSWKETTHLILTSDPPLREDLEPVWRDLLSHMLQREPEDRITLVQLRRHPLLQGSRKQVWSGRSSLANSQLLELPSSPRGPLTVSDAEVATALTGVRSHRREESQPRVLNHRATLRAHRSDGSEQKFLSEPAVIPLPHGMRLQPRPPSTLPPAGLASPR